MSSRDGPGYIFVSVPTEACTCVILFADMSTALITERSFSPLGLLPIFPSFRGPAAHPDAFPGKNLTVARDVSVSSSLSMAPRLNIYILRNFSADQLFANAKLSQSDDTVRNKSARFLQ